MLSSFELNPSSTSHILLVNRMIERIECRPWIVALVRRSGLKTVRAAFFFACAWIAAWMVVFDRPAAFAADAVTFLRAGATYTVSVWETDDGLPQNSVISMVQTRDGYLWLGTLNGLVRFDGIRFTVFDPTNTPNLPGRRIVHLFEDSRENLWVGTESGGAAMVRQGRVLSLDIGRGSRSGRLEGACEDSNGAVWLYTADGQLCRFFDDKVSVWRLGADRFSTSRSIVTDSGMLWVGTDWRLFGVVTTPAGAGASAGGSTGTGADPVAGAPRDLGVDTIQPINKLDLLAAGRNGGHWRLYDGQIQKWSARGVDRELGPYPWRTTPVSAACEDHEGNLLVGTLGAGVFWFDADGQSVQISTAQGLSNDYVLSLCFDREGSLWIGTDGGGLNRVKQQIFDVAEVSRGMVVQSVFESDAGDLWIGYNGGGVDHIPFLDDPRERFHPGKPLMNAPVRSVFMDRDRRVWAGTWGGGLFQFDGNDFRRAPGAARLHPIVLSVFEDRDGVLWVGTHGGLSRWSGEAWETFTTADGLSSNAVRALADDADSNLWIGTAGGLNRFSNGAIVAYREKDGFPELDISSLHMDQFGTLWIGTYAGGLVRHQNGAWTHYTSGDGLASDSVAYVLGDREHHLWIGTSAGLMRVHRVDLEKFATGAAQSIEGRVYGKPDGLPTRECTMGAQSTSGRSDGETLWFPTIKGLASVDSSRLETNPYPPPVVVESVWVEGRSANTNQLCSDWTEPIVIAPGQDRLEIHYTSLNLSAPLRARFRYRLEGFEDEWTDAETTRIARYTKLPPGRYRFRVTASNEDGVWNERGGVVAIIVEPPFWRTWWFLAVSGMFLLGSIVAVVHTVSTQKLHRQLEVLRQQQMLEKERSRIARDIHDQVGASLTQVALLGELTESDKDDPAEIESHARQISQTARDTTRILDEIVWAVNPANDTLDGLITYFCKYAQEYLEVAGIRYRMDIPSELPDQAIPPDVRHNVFLASKEAVTNIVRHAGAQSVKIRLRVEARGFTLEIEDDGRGIADLDFEAARSRNGLTNMRRRLEEIGGQFTIAPAGSRGTLIRLVAPLDPRLNHKPGSGEN